MLCMSWMVISCPLSRLIGLWSSTLNTIDRVTSTIRRANEREEKYLGEEEKKELIKHLLVAVDSYTVEG